MTRDKQSATCVEQRRSFLRNAGAALSAILAAGSVAAARRSHEEASAAAQVIRRLQHDFIDHFNNGRFAELGDLFAPAAQVHLWGGVFVGREGGIRRLYERHFGGGGAGPMQTYLLSLTPQLDTIQVAPDELVAAASWHCLVRTESAVAGPPTLVAMARQQGEGVLQWWESGLFESTCSKVGSTWRLSRLAYRELGDVDPALNFRCSKPRTAPLFTRCYPQHPTGPDRLLS
jgi:SnoaL-like protein